MLQVDHIQKIKDKLFKIKNVLKHVSLIFFTYIFIENIY